MYTIASAVCQPVRFAVKYFYQDASCRNVVVYTSNVVFSEAS